MGQRTFTLELTERELIALIRAIAFIEAGGGIDNEPVFDPPARERVRNKIHAVTQPMTSLE